MILYFSYVYQNFNDCAWFWVKLKIAIICVLFVSKAVWVTAETRRVLLSSYV